MDEIKQYLPSSYLFRLARDGGKTGRLEVTVFGTKEDLDDEINGTLIHSTVSAGKPPILGKMTEEELLEFKNKVIEHSGQNQK